MNSDKNSLAIIYMCLKMYCLKYVVNLILFLFMWPRCGYLMFHPAPPPVSATHFNPLITSAAPPLSSHQVQEVSGGAAHVCMVRLAIIWRSPPSGSLYKQPQFTVSSVVPVEYWKSESSLQFWLLHCHFSLLYYSIEVSLFRF